MPLINKKSLTLLFGIICLLSTINGNANEHAVPPEVLIDLDQQHQNFTRIFYRTLLKEPYYQTQKFSSMSALNTQLKIIADNDITQTALIINNLNLIKANYDSPSFFLLTKHLLDANAFYSAEQLIETIKAQEDASLTAHANYLLAEFYFQRQQWETSLAHLTSDIDLLATETFHHALLMKGILYQKQAQHSFAITFFKKIPQQSTYYISAQFNLAIANIKQGWWTDGHIILKKLLAQKEVQKDEYTLNRLYITLAYSQLKQGYYRTARSTFQKIGLDSTYTNQAILGLVLTAAHQDDDLDAINATRILKQKKQESLPVYESHLLMPYLYEKSSQLGAASIGYNEAANYYQAKVTQLTKTIEATKSASSTASDAPLLTELNIDFSQDYPDYYFKNRLSMYQYKDYISQPIREKYNQLNSAYRQLSKKMSIDILQQRMDNLNSYLDQTRYGLARLFDNNTAG